MAYGGEYNDILSGGEEDDYLSGRGGDDILTGGEDLIDLSVVLAKIQVLTLMMQKEIRNLPTVKIFDPADIEE